MSTHNTPLSYKRLKTDIPKLYPCASWPVVMIKRQWIELPMSRTNLNSPKDVRVIEVRLTQTIEKSK